MRVNQKRLGEALNALDSVICKLQGGDEILGTVWEAQETSTPVNAEILKQARAWSRLAPKIENYIWRMKDWHTIRESYGNEADGEDIWTLSREIAKAKGEF